LVAPLGALRAAWWGTGFCISRAQQVCQQRGNLAAAKQAAQGDVLISKDAITKLLVKYDALVM
jgi:hypothetical protein